MRFQDIIIREKTIDVYNEALDKLDLGLRYTEEHPGTVYGLLDPFGNYKGPWDFLRDFPEDYINIKKLRIPRSDRFSHGINPRTAQQEEVIDLLRTADNEGMLDITIFSRNGSVLYFRRSDDIFICARLFAYPGGSFRYNVIGSNGKKINDPRTVHAAYDLSFS